MREGRNGGGGGRGDGERWLAMIMRTLSPWTTRTCVEGVLHSLNGLGTATYPVEPLLIQAWCM